YEREYLVHLPPKEKMNAPVPLLFHLHGGGGTAKGTVGLTFGRFNELADRDGFIVVYPNAVEKNWNDGRKLDAVKAWKENIDDVGFIVAIVNALKKEYNIDTSRIFTTGMSNGGFMSSRLLCDRADIFRGGAILTASISADYLPKCKPELPTAVMVMNGTDDPLVPYDGGQIKVFKKNRGEIISTNEIMDFWKEKNGCTVKKNTVALHDSKADDTSVIVEEYSNCQDRGALVLYTIKGGGHTWPGGKQYLGERWIGKTNRDIVACDVIWEFFKTLPNHD
ncbi:MAG: PHB depolymerase family esterase, partial [Maribacter sp.]